MERDSDRREGRHRPTRRGPQTYFRGKQTDTDRDKDRNGKRHRQALRGTL